MKQRTFIIALLSLFLVPEIIAQHQRRNPLLENTIPHRRGYLLIVESQWNREIRFSDISYDNIIQMRRNIETLQRNARDSERTIQNQDRTIRQQQQTIDNLQRRLNNLEREVNNLKRR
ncbi:MAG: hypothetical protein FWC98_05640 [Bacteroidales bacterium]|nr:hypothetical protein [Bacteroidales bacterium]